MAPPSPGSRPHGRQPGEHGEQRTRPLRPLSRQQYDRRPDDRRPTGRQQPRYGRHSEAREGEAARRERRRTDRTAVLTGIVAVAALLLAGAGVWILAGGEDSGDATAPDPTAPSSVERPPVRTVPGAAVDAGVGDCIRVDDASAADADIAAIDCADRRAVYRVGVREERGAGAPAECPGPHYVSYTEEGGLLLCLTLNAREGDCFHEGERRDSRVACDSPKADYRVGRIFAGTDDPGRCGEEDAPNALTYPDPPLTICRLSVE
jgi:hypothetical protein